MCAPEAVDKMDDDGDILVGGFYGASEVGDQKKDSAADAPSQSGGNGSSRGKGKGKSSKAKRNAQAEGNTNQELAESKRKLKKLVA